MRRVAVVGTSGSGKTRFATVLAGKLGVPYLELDSIYHQQGWQPLEPEMFRLRVAAFAAGDGWVIDGNYSAVRDLVWAAADTVVILAYRRPTVMRRVIARSLVRMITRRELWSGNRERLSSLLSRDPEENIVLWSWTQYQKNLDRYLAAVLDPAWTHLRFLRFSDPAESEDFLTSPL